MTDWIDNDAKKLNYVVVRRVSGKDYELVSAYFHLRISWDITVPHCGKFGEKAYAIGFVFTTDVCISNPLFL